MKQSTLILLLFIIGLNCSAQKFNLKIEGISKTETKTIDSINYLKKHKDINSIKNELKKISEELTHIGYIDHKIIEEKHVNDSTFITIINLEKKINYIHIYIGINSEINKLLFLISKNDTIKINYTESETYLKNILKQLEQKGFALAKLNLKNFRRHNRILFADLNYNLNQKRLINSIVIKTKDNDKNIFFPKAHAFQINKKYSHRIFNKNTIEKIHNDFNKFKFTSQIKYPELLLTKDTTKIYVYLEKRNSNSFDGFIGFTNSNDRKITFNGYLDLNLENILRIGEQFSLLWKSDGNDQKTFRTNLEIPYLFNSPIGLKTHLQIFKQDSTFQNTNTGIALGYLIDYNTKIYLGYQSTESSDIQNTNNTTISDYKNSFVTTNLEYTKYDRSNTFFSKKTSLNLIIGVGKRNISNSTEKTNKNNQFYSNLNFKNNFYLNKKNSIYIDYQNYFLISDTFIINELFRFGGKNSIRGFEENSLQANFMTFLATEYRYTLSSDLYLHSILDYGYYKDKSTNNKENLIGIGLGFGLQTKNGLLKFNLTNGIFKNTNLKPTNSIVNIQYNVQF